MTKLVIAPQAEQHKETMSDDFASLMQLLIDFKKEREIRKGKAA